MDSGVEQIADADESRQVRRQARKVRFESTIAAALLTLLVVVFPSWH